jgi:hypothetical protein
MLLFLWFVICGPSFEGTAPAAARSRRGPNNQSDCAKADAQFNSITGGRDLLKRNMTIWIAAVYCALVVANAVKVASR